jgi:hypothetical protein
MGVQFNTIPPEALTQFRNSVNDVYAAASKMYGAPLVKLLQAAQ